VPSTHTYTNTSEYAHTNAHIHTHVHTHTHTQTHAYGRMRCTGSPDRLCQLLSVTSDAPSFVLYTVYTETWHIDGHTWCIYSIWKSHVRFKPTPQVNGIYIQLALANPVDLLRVYLGRQPAADCAVSYSYSVCLLSV
jgi:hypothetical protein